MLFFLRDEGLGFGFGLYMVSWTPFQEVLTGLCEVFVWVSSHTMNRYSIYHIVC